MGSTCPLCNRVHPPPPTPGRTPTIREDAYGAQREHHADGSMHPMGTWGSLDRRRRAAWCDAWAQFAPTPTPTANPAPAPASSVSEPATKEP